MALVDYDSSDSDSAEAPAPPPTKRRKSSGDGAAPSRDADAALPSMPPLPSAFHDLYASTVRQSIVDDPSLHQGRRRQVPHVVGNWPTHLYVEWHPTIEQHGMLVNLLDAVRAELSHEVKLHNFLTSDLGSPMPLHISLSRPLSLTTGQKDDFLEKAANTIRSANISVFHVHPNGLRWYKSPDSDRTFLILQVTSNAHSEDDDPGPLNPELTSLLTRCNTLAASFNQPILYERNQTKPIGGSFHISVGWTFDMPSTEIPARTGDLLRDGKFKRIQSWEVEVSGIKAKVGNVITHIPLNTLGSGNSLSTRLGSVFE